MSLFRRDPADPQSSRSHARVSAPSIDQVRSELARRRFRSAERREPDHSAHSVPPGGYRKSRAEQARDDRLSAHEAEVQRRAAEVEREAGRGAVAERAAPGAEPGDAPVDVVDGGHLDPAKPDPVAATNHRRPGGPPGGDADEDRGDGSGDADDAPSTTTVATLKRTFKQFSAHDLTDWAASLTYYGLLSLFPGLIAFVSILGIFGDPATTTSTLTDIVDRLAPGSASDTFQGPIQSIVDHKGTAGVMFFVGIFAALWSASGYIGAFMRASNAIYETAEGRPFWKLRPLQLLVTFVMVVMLVGVVLALVFTGPVVDAVAGPVGIGHSAVQVWNIAKWPALIAVVLIMLGVLYYASPNVRIPKFSLITPGAILALGMWVVASVAFAFYVGNFGSYDKTYGTLGGVISLLVWLWISNIAVLLGAQLNAEIERTRELRRGVPGAAEEIQLDPREAPKGEKQAVEAA
ncbi:MAG: YihY/virulence factor BrkB family protein [Patulibacter sp.]|nr:YihY/virulence factor BrkB family protein [Patulibacter sp.]